MNIGPDGLCIVSLTLIVLYLLKTFLSYKQDSFFAFVMVIKFF